MKYTIIILSLTTAAFCSCKGNNSSSPEIKANINTVNEAPARDIEISTGEETGRQLFEQKCAACHGNDGTAGIAGAANLRVSKMEKDLIVGTIANGKGGMPAFREQLTKKEIAQISDYVMTLHTNKNNNDGRK